MTKPFLAVKSIIGRPSGGLGWSNLKGKFVKLQAEPAKAEDNVQISMREK